MSNPIDIEYRTWKSKLILYLKGFSMGTADVIPGVSGGTIALISGIYEHLIFAISTIRIEEIKKFYQRYFKNQKEVKSDIPFLFLMVLGLGIASGILLMSKIIPFLMEYYTFYMYSLFFGLILFSTTIPYKKMDHGWREYLLMGVFAIITFLIMGTEPYKNFYIQLENPQTSTPIKLDDSGKFTLKLTPEEKENSLLKIYHQNEILGEIPLKELQPEYVWEKHRAFFRIKDEKTHYLIKGSLAKDHWFSFFETYPNRYLWIFFVASVAICAMILPGISGAYMLVLFGEYQNILKALHQWQFDVIFVFLLGMSVGILSFVRLLKFLLEKYHSLTMAALTGFLIGSLTKIFPFRYLDKPTTQEIALGVVVAILGAGFLYFLERLSIKLGDPEPPV
ncbi:MAG: DUF368 domain-containing protein [Leptospiraceae bacterium]|nr:DUF368 domain-containing protein [Leptospiraceae bacterium]MDW7977151.1 DUF368 domain-containing protein [Leptospiraceae bacterium]